MRAESSTIAARSQKPRHPFARSRTTNRPARMAIDGRTNLGRRVHDLVEVFVEQLGGWDALNDMEFAAVKKAAELVALAEQARADALHQGKVNPDVLLRFEGCADRAVRRLGIIGRKPARSLRQHLAEFSK